MDDPKRLFVLDTNVLMHDPSAIFRFQEHNIFIPMVVLEELDHAKKGTSEVARNVRQVSRFLDDLIIDTSKDEIEQGLELPGWGGNNKDDEQPVSGRLFFQTSELPPSLPSSLPGNVPDNNILGTALALQIQHQEPVTLVSKDINLRIKAAIVGLNAEDYSNDRVLDDVDLLYKGFTVLPADFWETHSKDVESWQQDEHTFYRICGPEIKNWHHGQSLFFDDESSGFEAIVRTLNDDHAIIELSTDHRNASHSVWGIMARNREQNFALNMLMDPDLDFVSLLGVAGTGKTLLALAAGLTQVLDHGLYSEIIMTRVTVPVGDDIGFLPGTEEEKMTPWMGALMDNLEVLTKTEGGGEWGRAATDDLLQSRIRIHSINFMRGRTFLNKYIILDEAQNLTAKQMKTLVTRAGPGTKIVCLGNIAQIDTPYLTETTSGLTYVVDKFKNWEHSGHITLITGERSRLAEFASDEL
ncbi:MAG: PhoH family protein [Pseudomonadota bacterium]|nr:PhoH family protein [Pseudomonadota bacterium]